MLTIVETIAEQRIREAMERGDFENLPGRGKPIDLSDYFKSPPHLRVVHHLLKNYGITPQEVELNKEISELKNMLSHTKVKTDKIRLLKQISSKSLQLQIMLERSKK